MAQDMCTTAMLLRRVIFHPGSRLQCDQDEHAHPMLPSGFMCFCSHLHHTR